MIDIGGFSPFIVLVTNQVVVRDLEVLMVLVMGNMVGMQRRMVVKPKNIRWLPNQSSWLSMIWASLLLSLF